MDYRFQLAEREDVEDDALAGLDEALAREAELMQFMGGMSAPSAPAPVAVGGDDPEHCPFEMGVAQPRAMSLAKLYELTSSPVPPEILATVGRARLPIIIVHSMTPFSRFGYPPTRVWGLGYQIDPASTDIVPVDFAPRSEFQEIADAGAEVHLGVSGDGKISADPVVLQAVNAVPGVNLNGLSASAGAKANVSLDLRLKLYVLKIMAGIVGRGVRWDFIEQDERMDRSLTMMHTILVPRDLEAIDMDVKVWVRRRRRFFDLKAARTWLIEPQRLTVDIER